MVDRLHPRESLERRRVLDEEAVAAREKRQRRALHKRRRAEQRARASGHHHDQKLLEALVQPTRRVVLVAIRGFRRQMSYLAKRSSAVAHTKWAGPPVEVAVRLCTLS